MPIDDSFNKAQYENHFDEYVETNQDFHIGGGSIQSRVELVQKYLPTGSKILEIGAGTGDDARALSQAGYKVTTTDFSEKFVDAIRSKGIEAAIFDAKKDVLPEGYNAVYANAVFVHFDTSELSYFLAQAAEKLEKPQLIFLSVIEGESQERRSGSNISFERDFQDYTEDQLRDLLSHAGFNVNHMELVDGRWLQVVASVPKE